MNLPQQLQEYLNYPKLQLIDANSSLPEDELIFDPLTQAVLITFLAGLFKATRSKEAAAVISTHVNAQQLLADIFINEDDVINTITAYCNQPYSVVKEKLDETSAGYFAFVQLQLQGTDEIKKEDYLHNLMTAQRNEILKYLPPNLKLGDLLNDQALEDNTNKMEGPISSLMHKIENAFSKSD